MRGNYETGNTYPYKAVFQEPNKPFGEGGWAIQDVRKQEVLPEHTGYTSEAKVLAAINTLKGQA